MGRAGQLRCCPSPLMPLPVVCQGQVMCVLGPETRSQCVTTVPFVQVEGFVFGHVPTPQVSVSHSNAPPWGHTMPCHLSALRKVEARVGLSRASLQGEDTRRLVTFSGKTAVKSQGKKRSMKKEQGGRNKKKMELIQTSRDRRSSKSQTSRVIVGTHH